MYNDVLNQQYLNRVKYTIFRLKSEIHRMMPTDEIL